MTFENLKVDPILRENYEAQSLVVEMLGAIGAFGCTFGFYVPKPVFFLALGYILFFCGQDAYDALNVYRQHRALQGRPLFFISIKKLLKKTKDHLHEQWIGLGFAWQQKHAQKVSLIQSIDFQSKIKNPYADTKMGVGWIHGVEVDEEIQWQPIKHLEGHTLVVGNPGTGKTRLFDLLITQCIQRGESVIIIDPKGDAALRENARQACIALGKERDFLFFHPAFPDQSIAIDPLKNFDSTGELASRISALLPNSSGNEPFAKYSWQVLNTICQAMIYIGVAPSLVKLQRYVANMDSLVFGVIERLARNIDTQNDIVQYQFNFNAKMRGRTSIEEKANAAVSFYHQNLERKYHPEAVAAIVSLFEHDREHYQKMNASLPPVLQLLTEGSLRYLLSPSDGNSENPVFNMTEFFKTQKVVCIGLNSLANGKVGESVGSLFLADLTAVAGEIFNNVAPDKMRPVNIFVDEVCEVLNDPFVQLLNKGRGAGIRLFVATQSVSDFASKTGGKDRANQILGNINNKFAFRTLDEATQAYLSEHMLSTVVRYSVKSQGVGGQAEAALADSGHAEEKFMEKDIPLVAPQLFGLLPNLEYFGFISGGKTIKCRIPIVTDDGLVGEVSKLKHIQEYLLEDAVSLASGIRNPVKEQRLAAINSYDFRFDSMRKEKLWKN